MIYYVVKFRSKFDLDSVQIEAWNKNELLFGGTEVLGAFGSFLLFRAVLRPN